MSPARRPVGAGGRLVGWPHAESRLVGWPHARFLQGFGAGAVPAVGYVAIGRAFPQSLRARMMAVLSTAWVVPGMIGPLISAGVAHAFGRRWVFLGLVPLVAVAGALALPGLVRLGRPGVTPVVEHRLVDAVRAASGTGLVLIGVTSDRLVLAVALVAVGVVVLVPGLRRLVPVGTVTARRGLPATVLSRGLLTFAYLGADAFVTLAIVSVRHHSVAVAGIAATGSTLGWTAGAWVQARLDGWWEASRLVRSGLGCVVVGVVGMVVFLRPGVPMAMAVIAWTVAGLGMGLAYAPISLMMLREAPEGREGWASPTGP